jgi:hypothetical protein
MELPRAYNGLALSPRAKTRFRDKSPEYLPTNIITLQKNKKIRITTKTLQKLNISLQLENKTRH